MATTKVDVNLIDASGIDPAKFLRGDGTWEAAGAGTSVTTTKTTGTTTLTDSDASGYVTVPCDSSGGNVIIKLPAAASSWSGSILHIVASTAPGTGYNVVIQNSAATELAQLNKKGDYYTVTCDSAGSNLVVIDHQQTYTGWLVTTAQQGSMSHTLGNAQLFIDPAKYSIVENYGNWWDSSTDKLTVSSGWVGNVELTLAPGVTQASYVSSGLFKDGSALIAPIIYSADGAPLQVTTNEAVTGGEYYEAYGYNTYTSSTRYIESGCVFKWVGKRNA